MTVITCQRCPYVSTTGIPALRTHFLAAHGEPAATRLCFGWKDGRPCRNLALEGQPACYEHTPISYRRTA